MKLSPPTRLFLEITTECNLRCVLCKLWQNKDPSSKLSLKQKIQIIEKLVSWLTTKFSKNLSHFSIIFTGGEPFLYPEQVFQLSYTCRKYGFLCFVNTNGFLLRPFISSLVSSGLTAVTISLDSHQEDIHDALRGSPGVFKRVVQNVKAYVIERAKQNSSQKIYIQSILGKWNADIIEDHVKWLTELGVDGVMFQCLQYPFGLPIPSKLYIDFEYFPDIKSIHKASRRILQMKKQGYPIKNSEEEILWWEEYFKCPQYLPGNNRICRAYEQNIIVDILGNIKYCFNKELTPLNRIGNICNNSFDEIWTGERAKIVKDEMKQCNRSCGLMLCHCDQNLMEW